MYNNAEQIMKPNVVYPDIKKGLMCKYKLYDRNAPIDLSNMHSIALSTFISTSIVIVLSVCVLLSSKSVFCYFRI